jgi:hypothetical protein
MSEAEPEPEPEPIAGPGSDNDEDNEVKKCKKGFFGGWGGNKPNCKCPKNHYKDEKDKKKCIKVDEDDKFLKLLLGLQTSNDSAFISENLKPIIPTSIQNSIIEGKQPESIQMIVNWEPLQEIMTEKQASHNRDEARAAAIKVGREMDAEPKGSKPKGAKPKGAKPKGAKPKGSEPEPEPEPEPETGEPFSNDETPMNVYQRLLKFLTHPYFQVLLIITILFVIVNKDDVNKKCLRFMK